MAMKSITAIHFCYFFCETATFCIVCFFFFVRKIVTTPLFLLLLLFRSNIMHLTDIVSWGKLNHLIKFFLMVSLEMIVVRGFLGS